MTQQRNHPSRRTRTAYQLAAVGLAVLSIAGLSACSDDVKDALAFGEYAAATADVLDANDIDAKSGIDCDGSTETNDVTCTSTTTGGLRIESAGENLGEEGATLVVMVDGEIFYDGLLDDTP